MLRGWKCSGDGERVGDYGKRDRLKSRLSVSNPRIAALGPAFLGKISTLSLHVTYHEPDHEIDYGAQPLYFVDSY